MTTETAAERLMAARVRLLDTHPYLARALFAISMHPFTGLGTLAVDNKWRLAYDPDILAAWSVPEIAGVLYHEVLHLLRDHAGRVGHRIPSAWNIACDAEINDDLREETFTRGGKTERINLPGSPIFPEALGQKPHLTAEEYYSAAYDQAQPIGTQNGAQPTATVGSGLCGSAATGVPEAWEEALGGTSPTPRGDSSSGSERTSADDGQGTSHDDGDDGQGASSGDGDGGQGTSSGDGDDGQGASSGDSGQGASSGDGGQGTSSGDGGQGTSSGDDGQGASSGDGGQGTSSGDGGQDASSGDGGQDASSGVGGQGTSNGDGGQGTSNGDGGQGVSHGDGGQGVSHGDGGQGVSHGDGGQGVSRGDARHGDPQSGTHGDTEGVSPGEADIIRRLVAQEVTKSRGTVPGHLARFAEGELEPERIDWRRELRSIIARTITTISGAVDYTYTRPSRRQSAVSGVVLPALREPVVRAAVVVDTSGSMSQPELGTALAQINLILQSCGAREGLVVLAVDATVHATKRVFRANEVQLIGGGGTDMRVAIKAAVNLRPRPEVVIVLTDGYTPWPHVAPPGIRVIAGLTGTGANPVPEWIKAIAITS
jgi:predicted metal-dependent peptidase